MDPVDRMEQKLTRIVEAIRTINKYHNLGDAIYRVREAHGGDDVDGKPYEGDSWHHPKVSEYNAAHTVLREEGVL